MQNEKDFLTLDMLIGQPVTAIGRASNMLWIGFGERIRVLNYKGQPRSVSRFAVHVQSAWRITSRQEERILLSQGDFYRPSKGIKWAEDFDWEKRGNNLFDENLPAIILRMNGVCVSGCACSKYNDLTIVLSNDDMIEVFVDETEDSECWRFFQSGTDSNNTKHLVAYGNSIGFE